MAVIGKIRKYSGLLIATIGIALAAFVLSDFMKGGNSNSVDDFAIINGEKISYNDFERIVESQIVLYQQQTGNDKLSQDETNMIRQQAWNTLLRETILRSQIEELGLIVSKDELENIIWGNNPHPYIVQSFTNPETQQFDQERVKNIWLNIDRLEPEFREQLIQLEQEVKKDHLFQKYYNLVRKGYYVTIQQAKQTYQDQADVAMYKFMMYEYNKISDSTVTVTDADYEKYYEENKLLYKQKESRGISYIVFDVMPSEQDQAEMNKEILDIKKDFETVPSAEIGEFVNRASDLAYDSSYFKKEQLSLGLDSVMFNAPIGTVYGPYMENNFFTLAKLVDIKSRPDSLKASHILIAYKGALRAGENVVRTKTQAKTIADSLLQVVKKGGIVFDSIAVKHSDDPSVKQNMGDMDWFTDNSGFAYEFKKACIDNSVGDIVITHTDFGYHIIKVTGKTEAIKKAQIAYIKRENTPSEATYQSVYTLASNFAGQNNTKEKFEKAVTEQGLVLRRADYLLPMEYRIAGLESPRAIVKWAFDEKRELDDVSPVFDLSGKFVVALLTSVKEEGIPSLANVKDMMKSEVIRHKKAEKIIEIIKQEQAGAKSVAELAAKLNLTVDTVDRASFVSPNIPKAGREPKVVGAIFAMQKGEVSQPIEGNRGVFVVEISDYIQAPEVSDFSGIKASQESAFQQKVNYIYGALEEASDIEDNRIQYY